VVDAFVDKLDLSRVGFDGVVAEATGRPSYHPAVLLKLYIYGYLNRVQSSRRLEREAGRNVEVMWLTGRLIPDHKTIADFRKDSGPAIKQVCVQFVELCRLMGLLTNASVAIDGSKFKAVNTRDKNFTRGKVERRRAQLEKSVARYLAQLDTADRQEPSEELAAKTAHLKEKLVKVEREMQRLAAMERLMLASLRRYWTNACQSCAIKQRCTTGKQRRITRWEHEHLLEAVQKRLDKNPHAMRQRRETAEHPFGTLKMRMGATHFLKRLSKVATEMALHVLAYNLTLVMNVIGSSR
jgi:transposase